MRAGDALAEKVLLRQLNKLLRGLKIISLQRCGKVNGCLMEKTEERAITLSQLRSVYAHIERRCERERWTNVHGKLLSPEYLRVCRTPCHSTERLRA